MRMYAQVHEYITDMTVFDVVVHYIQIFEVKYDIFKVLESCLSLKDISLKRPHQQFLRNRIYKRKIDREHNSNNQSIDKICKGTELILAQCL